MQCKPLSVGLSKNYLRRGAVGRVGLNVGRGRMGGGAGKQNGKSQQSTNM